MDHKIDINVELIGGSPVVLSVLEANLSSALETLKGNTGIVEGTNGQVVKASAVASYQVVR